MTEALGIVSKNNWVERKRRFKMGRCCFSFRYKLTDLNPIALAFRQIDSLDSASRIEMVGPL